MLIQQNKIFSMDQVQVIFRLCCKPPTKLVLILKLLKYLENLGIPSGIDLVKQNFPDKAWLILAIATVSQGKDEIFDKDFLPSASQIRQNSGSGLQQPPANIDPIFR